MVNIDKLYRIAIENAVYVKDYRKRFIYEEIKKMIESHKITLNKKPLILLSGVRGIGKTTILLQLFQDQEIKNAFYFSADSILIKSETLYAVIEEVYRLGYTLIFIDEIHKYSGWVEELKNVYDNFNIQIVCSGSSTASLKKGSILLGRRAINLQITPLSFGEYFYLIEGEKYFATIDDAIDNKLAIKWLAEHSKVEKYYKKYLEVGGFPMKIEGNDTIFKLIKKMIYEDALAEFNLTKNKVDVAERLLAFLSLSKPGEFSYTSFSSMSGYAKSTIYETTYMLKELEILRIVEEKTPKAMAKATIKFLFSHPNLRSVFAEQLMREAEKGALREEYFVFHMANLGFSITLPKKMKKTPDYEIKIHENTLLFEIGGHSKTNEQFMRKEGILMNDEKLIVLGFVQKSDQK